MMTFITEESIMKFVDNLELSEKSFFEIRDEIIDKQTFLAAVLTDDNLDILKEEEFDLLWFMCVVIYGSAKLQLGELGIVKQKPYQDNEEENWKIWNETKSKDFKSKLNPFFENYSQEDLLAFVEDSLESDEDVNLSVIGQEILFIQTKTLIDSLLPNK